MKTIEIFSQDEILKFRLIEFIILRGNFFFCFFNEMKKWNSFQEVYSDFEEKKLPLFTLNNIQK